MNWELFKLYYEKLKEEDRLLRVFVGGPLQKRNLTCSLFHTACLHIAFRKSKEEKEKAWSILKELLTILNNKDIEEKIYSSLKRLESSRESNDRRQYAWLDNILIIVNQYLNFNLICSYGTEQNAALQGPRQPLLKSYSYNLRQFIPTYYTSL